MLIRSILHFEFQNWSRSDFPQKRLILLSQFSALFDSILYYEIDQVKRGPW